MSIQKGKLKQINDMIEKFNNSYPDRLFGFLTEQLIKLLPGGKIYTAYQKELIDNIEIQESLILLGSAIKDIEKSVISEHSEILIEKSVLAYLNSFERVLREHFDSASLYHQEALEILKTIKPPPKIINPILFLISGPSASGKDTLLRSVYFSCRARGFPLESLLKYTTREPRPGEKESGFNYYEYPTIDEFKKLENKGEIVFIYPKNHYRYGFSNSEINELKCKSIPRFCIISDFQRFEDITHNIRQKGIRALSILIWAKYDYCHRRMFGRNLDPKEINIRLNEARSDCEYIWNNKKQVYNKYNLVIENGDNISIEESSKELYKYFVDNLILSSTSNP